MGTLARNRLKIRRLHFNNQGLAKEAKSLLSFRNCETLCTSKPHKKRIEYKKKMCAKNVSSTNKSE